VVNRSLADSTFLNAAAGLIPTIEEDLTVFLDLSYPLLLQLFLTTANITPYSVLLIYYNLLITWFPRDPASG
jgi:hypothetical protein